MLSKLHHGSIIIAIKYAGNVQIKNVSLLNRVNPTYVIKDCILVVLLQVTS